MEFKVGDMVVRTCSEECHYFVRQDSYCREAPEEFEIVQILPKTPGEILYAQWGEVNTAFCPACCLRPAQTYKVVGNALVLEEQ